MKLMAKLTGTLFLCGLTILSSCIYYQENNPNNPNNPLTGQIYVNETTLDKIEFAERDTIIFTWASDFDWFWRKDHPFKYCYSIGEQGNDIQLGCFSTSGEYANFPYQKRLEFSDSKDVIYFTDIKGKSGVFKRQSNP